jgi:hypothetical protein
MSDKVFARVHAKQLRAWRYGVADVVSSYHSLNTLFRVYDGDHLQIVSRKKLADRSLIQVLRSCDHVGQHNILDGFVAGSY